MKIFVELYVRDWKWNVLEIFQETTPCGVYSPKFKLNWRYDLEKHMGFTLIHFSFIFKPSYKAILESPFKNYLIYSLPIQDWLAFLFVAGDKIRASPAQSPSWPLSLLSCPSTATLPVLHWGDAAVAAVTRKLSRDGYPNELQQWFYTKHFIELV